VQPDAHIFWSDTSGADGTEAWFACMHSGRVYSYGNKTTYFFYVWPVRGGQ
jgi:hypothetical protein